MKRRFSVSEAAEALEVTERTIWNYIKRGDLRAYRARSGSGRSKLWIDYISLKKCVIRHNSPVTYIARDRMVKDTIAEALENARVKIALREVGVKSMQDALDNLSIFSVDEKELDDLIERYTEYWDKYDIAAYMEVSLTTVKKYIRRGLLKPSKTDRDGRKLFSSIEVMELYRSLHTGGQNEAAEEVDNRSLYELYDYIMRNPACIPHLQDILR